MPVAALLLAPWLLAASMAPAALDPPVEAEHEPAAPLPYEPWPGRHHPPPERRLLDGGPAPLGDEPELARRPLELVAGLGVSRPACDGGDRWVCQGPSLGSEIAVAGLFRATPYFAAGMSLTASGGLPGGGARRDGFSGNAWFLGATGRVYLFESGLGDPYLELSLGVASLGASLENDGVRQRERAFLVPSARVAAGYDFVLSSFVRVGPSLSWARYAVGSTDYCVAGRCEHRRADASALPLGATILGLRITYVSGEPL